MPRKTYNPPKRKCVVKTRLTEDERKAFEDKCAVLSMSQSCLLYTSLSTAADRPALLRHSLDKARRALPA